VPGALSGLQPHADVQGEPKFAGKTGYGDFPEGHNVVIPLEIRRSIFVSWRNVPELPSVRMCEILVSALRSILHARFMGYGP
jgi:hypothetical protein